MMVELPAEHEALQRAIASAPADKYISIHQVAAEALRLMSRGWSHRQGKICQTCLYEPSVVRYYLRTWEELASAADGVSASGANPITSGGSRDRDRHVAIKADIELATDKAFTNHRYLTWEAVRRIYIRQKRHTYYMARRRELVAWVQAGHTATPKPEPPRAEAEGYCIELIAANLGWFPHECEEAA